MSSPLEHDQAIALNQSRREEAKAKFIGVCITPAGLAKLFPDLTPKDVEGLFSQEVGGVRQFPLWQFNPDGPRSDLPKIRSALGNYTPDAITADRVMQQVRDELGGLSILEALDSNDLALRTTAHVAMQDAGGGQ